MAIAEKEKKEKRNLLGRPSFKKLKNGRLKCLETGHELLAKDKESYSQSKSCQLGLMDVALSRNKPPFDMFNQDPLCRLKLICKLTGDIVNKSEEHVWKHINGRRFLDELEKKEEEKRIANEILKEEEKKQQEAPKPSVNGDEKEKKNKNEGDVDKKGKEKKKNKNKGDDKIKSNSRNTYDKDIDSEDGVNGAADGEVLDSSKASEKLSVRKKRKSKEIKPNSIGSKKKKSQRRGTR